MQAEKSGDTISNMWENIDVTDEYKQRFVPNTGKIEFDDNYVRTSLSIKDEINLSSWVDENYENWFIHMLKGEWGYVFNKEDYDKDLRK